MTWRWHGTCPFISLRNPDWLALPPLCCDCSSRIVKSDDLLNGTVEYHATRVKAVNKCRHDAKKRLIELNLYEFSKWLTYETKSKSTSAGENVDEEEIVVDVDTGIHQSSEACLQCSPNPKWRTHCNEQPFLQPERRVPKNVAFKTWTTRSAAQAYTLLLVFVPFVNDECTLIASKNNIHSTEAKDW